MRPIVKRTLKLAGLIVIASGILFLGALIHEHPLWFFGIRNINTSRYFPDPVFRQEVERYMGVKPGQPFSEEQASIRKESFYMNSNLNPYSGGKVIQSLKGIEYLKSLQEFHCSDYSIAEMDLSKNKNLVSLSFQDTTVWKNVLPINSKLESLSIAKTRLGKITLSDFPRLQKFELTDCGLTSLDLSQCPQLRELNCSSNQLTTLDLSQNPNLQRLNCDGNLLTSLNLSNLKNLQMLYCANNRLSSLDVSQNSLLSNLNCSKNQLTQINFGTIQELKSIDCNNNLIDDMKQFMPFPWLVYLLVENNRLDREDAADLLTIKTQMEKMASESSNNYTHFSYSPQPGIDPYILPATQ